MSLGNRVRAAKTLGYYRPAFFKMDVSFPLYPGVSPLSNLSEADLATFFHEYIHFLQDISSYSLLNNAYVYNEYMHTAINYAYSLSEEQFVVPIQMPDNLGNVDANIFTNETCMGNVEEIDNLFITNIRVEEVPFPYPGQGIDHFDQVVLRIMPEKEVRFGYLAVMESMAYILERRLARPSVSAPDYPYMSAQMVVEFIYPEFGKEELNVLALCDTALQFSNSGNVFFQFLKMMKLQQWLPTMPEDVYQYVYSQQAYMNGRTYSVQGLFNQQSHLVENLIKDYIKDPILSREFHPFVHHLMDYGRALRLKKPYFMIELARGGYVKHNRFFSQIINTLGMPIIEDGLHKYRSMPPLSMIQMYRNVHEIFPAIEQVYKCLHDGSDICEMIDHCQDSEQQYKAGRVQHPVPIVDDRCYTAPWRRCTDARLCPYAIIWRHWKMSDRMPRVAPN